MSGVKKCLKYICVGHPGYRILYAIVHVITGVGESKVLTYREEIIKRKRKGAESGSHRIGKS